MGSDNLLHLYVVQSAGSFLSVQGAEHFLQHAAIKHVALVAKLAVDHGLAFGNQGQQVFTIEQTQCLQGTLTAARAMK